MDRTGLLIILSSPSGAGKSTLAQRLMAWDSRLRFSVSATTRPPRPGETDGQHYYFLTPEAFRAQVSEGVNLAAAAKAAISETFLNRGKAPLTRAAAGMSATGTDTRGKYVTGVDVVNGEIVITYGYDANAQINGKTLGIAPYETPDLSVAWRCGGSAQTAGTNLLGTSGGAAAAYTGGTLNNVNLHKYLPSACRP